MKGIGIELLIPVTIIAASLVINRFDEPIERSTQAWLDAPVRTVPEAKNGYLALLALDAKAADPLAGAAAWVRDEHVIFAESRKSRQNTTVRYKASRQKLLNPSGKQIAVTNCKVDCYKYFLAHGALMQKQFASNADLMTRYSSMLDFPAYAEDVPRDPEAFYPNYSMASGLGMLYLAKVVHTLQQGDAETAYKDWARHQRFWQVAAAGSTSLLGFLQATAQLERSQALLSSLLADSPRSLAAARRHALPVLDVRPNLPQLAARSMVTEFQMQAYVFTDLLYHSSLFGIGDDQPRLVDGIALYFYQPNASVNLLHRLHQNDLTKNGAKLDGKLAADTVYASADATCAFKFDRHILSNPLGKMFMCNVDSFDLQRYHQRATKAESSAYALEKLLLSTNAIPANQPKN